MISVQWDLALKWMQLVLCTYLRYIHTGVGRGHLDSSKGILWDLMRTPAIDWNAKIIQSERREMSIDKYVTHNYST